MNNNEKQFEDFVGNIKFDDTPDPKHRDKLEMNLREAMAKQPRQIKIWRIIMKSNVSKLAAAIIIIGIVLSFFALEKFSSSAWAIEQTIEALRDLRAIHMIGTFPGGTAEIWIRANKIGTQSGDVIVRGSHGAVTWIKDGSTYHYEPSQNTVYFENAVTVGFSQWLGPELLEMLSKVDGAKIMRGRDPATGCQLATLLCSLLDSNGPQSWIIEFDIKTKLPISLKQWSNLDMSGPPAFHAFKITYYEDLPDSLFEVNIPGNPVYVEKPLAIPDENIGILSNPKKGISAEGLNRQQACEQIIQTMYNAVIEGDLDELKKLAPLSENWGDEFLNAVILRTGKVDRIVEVVKIGQIFKTGDSKIGQIVALPVVFKRVDGSIVEQNMIVQFRQLGGESSCVVHGPYGLPRELE
ncbi:MAG: hypothetical protein RQ760_01435 [Sedimentisphaerales bacterium]|nr:hypothetical protein [Sedimentisphaerales bacterium]